MPCCRTHPAPRPPASQHLMRNGRKAAGGVVHRGQRVRLRAACCRWWHSRAGQRRAGDQNAVQHRAQCGTQQGLISSAVGRCWGDGLAMQPALTQRREGGRWQAAAAARVHAGGRGAVAATAAAAAGGAGRGVLHVVVLRCCCCCCRRCCQQGVLAGRGRQRQRVGPVVVRAAAPLLSCSSRGSACLGVCRRVRGRARQAGGVGFAERPPPLLGRRLAQRGEGRADVRCRRVQGERRRACLGRMTPGGDSRAAARAGEGCERVLPRSCREAAGTLMPALMPGTPCVPHAPPGLMSSLRFRPAPPAAARVPVAGRASNLRAESASAAKLRRPRNKT